MAKTSKPLVVEHLENISRKALEKYQPIIKEYVKGKKGVYALYKGDRLKYVGLAGNLRGRLSSHLRDRHADSWDKFSVYLTEDDEHLRELEALVIRISKPKSNIQRGKFAKSENLLTRFKSDIAKQQRDELDEIIGTDKAKNATKGPATSGIKDTAAKKGDKSTKTGPQLAPYVQQRFKITCEHKEYIYEAKVLANGMIRLDGKLFESPSKAAMEITKASRMNGWKFWKYRNDKGEWVYIEELRNKKTKSKNKSRLKKSTLAPYVNERFRIRADYKGQRHWAVVRKDGTINYNGEIFTSPSYAGKAATGNATQGPLFWKFKNKQGEWVPLKELMK